LSARQHSRYQRQGPRESETLVARRRQPSGTFSTRRNSPTSAIIDYYFDVIEGTDRAATAQASRAVADLEKRLRKLLP
jgi:hypothetical protein